MAQEITSYIILFIAFFYIGKRIYSSIRKKDACSKCALMDAAKKNKKSF